MFCQLFPPERQFLFRNPKREMSWTAAILFRQGTWRQDIAAVCFVRRMRSLAIEQQEITLLANTKHAADATRF